MVINKLCMKQFSADLLIPVNTYIFLFATEGSTINGRPQ